MIARLIRTCALAPVLVVAAACAGSSGRTSSPVTTGRSTTTTSTGAPSTPATATTTRAPAAPTTPPPEPAPRTTTVQLTLVDTTRPTVSHGSTVASTRTLPTTVWLPADAQGHPIGNHLPWLVFLHGYDAEPATYTAMLEHWARAGYAVAAPLLPLTSSQSGAVLDEADMVNEPADVSYLITALLARSAAASGPLSGRLDPARIGVAGHSDGANVAFATGYSRQLGDPRIDAVIDESGEFPSGMGPYPSGTAGPPLLMIVSDTDEFVPRSQSQELYDAVGVPRWWVELHGVAHLPPFGATNSWSAVVDQATVDFLDLTLGGYAVAPSTIAKDAQQPPTANLAAGSP